MINVANKYNICNNFLTHYNNFTQILTENIYLMYPRLFRLFSHCGCQVVHQLEFLGTGNISMGYGLFKDIGLQF